MLLWKPRDLAGAFVVSASLITGVSADDLVAADDAPGHATMTPFEQVKQETAQQRWERIKAKYQPVVVEPTKTPAALGASQPVSGTNEAQRQAPTRGSAAPPLPDATEEPAWVVTGAPAETLTEPLAKPQSTQPASPVLPQPAPQQEVIAPDEFADLEFDDDTGISTVGAQADPTLPPMPGSEGMPTSTRRPVRSISEIQPFYDTQIDADIRDYANERAADYDVKFGSEEFQPRMFPDTAMPWEPSNVYHYPLYFEDAVLERYGHTYPFVVQPFVSVAKFSGQFLALPYQMTLDPIKKPKYALGWYRPGEVAPKLKYQIPWNAQAAAVEAGVVTGLFFLIP